MVLGLILLGITLGLCAATWAVLAGAGFWLACLAYAGAGGLGLLLGVLILLWRSGAAPVSPRHASGPMPVPGPAPGR